MIKLKAEGEKKCFSLEFFVPKDWSEKQIECVLLGPQWKQCQTNQMKLIQNNFNESADFSFIITRKLMIRIIYFIQWSRFLNMKLAFINCLEHLLLQK